eukprot:SAG22_NODE_1198_length_5193_cov_12.289360_3_plen_91_part_00
MDLCIHPLSNTSLFAAWTTAQVIPYHPDVVDPSLFTACHKVVLCDAGGHCGLFRDRSRGQELVVLIQRWQREAEVETEAAAWIDPAAAEH